MDLAPSAHEILGAMITPAVLISAGGSLVLSTSNRLSRVVDRVRVLAQEAERLPPGREEASARRQLIAGQLSILTARVLLLRTAMTALYTAIGLLVMTSIAVGVTAAWQWRYGWIPVVLGLGGACALLYGSLLLVREARFAVNSTLQEMSFVRAAITPPHGA